MLSFNFKGSQIYDMAGTTNGSLVRNGISSILILALDKRLRRENLCG